MELDMLFIQEAPYAFYKMPVLHPQWRIFKTINTDTEVKKRSLIYTSTNESPLQPTDKCNATARTLLKSKSKQNLTRS
ncbi:hypothetical protein GX48_07236 [Paracoccidioides brasiliensis]|nr:hypothetical protein GX48_07236 [Paracoccidioides brasiliensis]